MADTIYESRDGRVALTRFFAGRGNGMRYQLTAGSGYTDLSLEEVATIAVGFLVAIMAESEAQGGDTAEIRRMMLVAGGQ